MSGKSLKTPVDVSKFIPSFLGSNEKSREQQKQAKEAFKAKLAAAKGKL